MHKSPTIIYVSSKVAGVIEAGLQKNARHKIKGEEQ